jgi:catechol 2,3-dioxygenase-like lactoylglutathione lyase family enzyme
VNAEEVRGHSNASIDMKLEVIVIPVSDVDRAKEFYTSLGWRLDADVASPNGFRLIQFTPPGSGSSSGRSTTKHRYRFRRSMVFAILYRALTLWLPEAAISMALP